jgi:hypothetical protein
MHACMHAQEMHHIFGLNAALRSRTKQLCRLAEIACRLFNEFETQPWPQFGK